MTMRYYLQMYGLLALFAAWGLVALWDSTTDDRRPTLRRRSGPATGPLAPMAGGRWSVVGRRGGSWYVVLGLCLYANLHAAASAHRRFTLGRRAYPARIGADLGGMGLPTAARDRRGAPFGHTDSRSLFDRFRRHRMPTTRKPNIPATPGPMASMRLVCSIKLDQADYVILSSNRAHASATRMPMRYPALIRYYRALFDGDLGFELVADVTSYRTLFGVAIPDESAEEAFSVYDYPRGADFKKTAGYSRARAEQLITSGIAWGEA